MTQNCVSETYKLSRTAAHLTACGLGFQKTWTKMLIVMLNSLTSKASKRRCLQFRCFYFCDLFALSNTKDRRPCQTTRGTSGHPNAARPLDFLTSNPSLIVEMAEGKTNGTSQEHLLGAPPAALGELRRWRHLWLPKTPAALSFAMLLYIRSCRNWHLNSLNRSTTIPTTYLKGL